MGYFYLLKNDQLPDASRLSRLIRLGRMSKFVKMFRAFNEFPPIHFIIETLGHKAMLVTESGRLPAERAW